MDVPEVKKGRTKNGEMGIGRGNTMKFTIEGRPSNGTVVFE
jgi:hypothetical protein